MRGTDQVGRPILRWVGGKARLARSIVSMLPELERGATYYEPFLGAGSVFLALSPRRAVLGDRNDRLVQCFKLVKQAPEKVWRVLRSLSGDTSEAAYYRARERFNKTADASGYTAAALFIYLNRTCFNGIWRVNQRDEYNVPWGALSSPAFPDLESLRDLSQRLSSARLRSGDFESTLREARSGDLVYLDPPYPPISDTAFFTHYTNSRFGVDEQRRVAIQFRKLDERGCRVVMSNADRREIRRLYSGYEVASLPVSRFVAAYGRRHRVKDLLVANFPLGR